MGHHSGRGTAAAAMVHSVLADDDSYGVFGTSKHTDSYIQNKNQHIQQQQQDEPAPPYPPVVGSAMAAAMAAGQQRGGGGGGGGTWLWQLGGSVVAAAAWRIQLCGGGRSATVVAVATAA